MNADPEIDITKSNLEIPPPPNGPVSPYNEEIYDEEQSLTGKYGNNDLAGLCHPTRVGWRTERPHFSEIELYF